MRSYLSVASRFALAYDTTSETLSVRFVGFILPILLTDDSLKRKGSFIMKKVRPILFWLFIDSDSLLGAAVLITFDEKIPQDHVRSLISK